MENLFWRDVTKLTDFLEQVERFLRTKFILRLTEKTVSGDLVFFGGYSWIVLTTDEEEGKYLLLARQLLSIMPMKYNREKIDVTWENADIRAYLNGIFYQKFSDADKEKIQDTKTNNPATPWFDTPGGNETVDKVFLLSLEELANYLGDSGQLAKKGWPQDKKDLSKPCIIEDEYNNLHKAINEFGEEFPYWLRSAGRDSTCAALVREDGSIDLGGESVDATAGVRPAIWVKI